MRNMNYLHPSTETMSSKGTNPSEENLIGRNYLRQEQFVQEKNHNQRWKLLSLFLAVLCALLVTLFIGTAVMLYMKGIRNTTESDTLCFEDVSCMQKNKIDKETLFKGNVNAFSELTSLEIDNVVKFLHSQEFLNLAELETASMNSSYIHLIEMLPPPKRHVLEYLEAKRPLPPRFARAFIFRGNIPEPVVEEYKVGPLPKPTHLSVIKTNSRKTKVPFFMRPFSKHEFKAVYKHILPVVLEKANRILVESYNASMINCGNQCLKFTTTPISSGMLEKGKRKCWFWFTYDIEFYTLHPLDFQFLVDMSDPSPEQWKVQRVYYANQLFRSLEDLKYKYENGNINKTRVTFPTQPKEDQYSSVYIRGKPVPEHPLPPPQQVQPAGPRYTMTGNQLEYMDWSFNVRVSPAVGTQLYDIRYRGERIVYELSMQEIGVLYSGSSPASSMMYFADSAGLFGTRMRGMMPGIDCPEHGTMLDALSYTSLSMGKMQAENSLCIFEHASETLVRRHRAYSMTGASYSGLQDYSLVVRMYICIINYDYIFDFVFHNNGAIEVKVSSTGYLASSFYHPQEIPYGMRISENVIAGLHHHLFHFKADIDIKGTANRVQTMSIGKVNKTNTWADNPHRQHVQNIIKEADIVTEKQASTEYKFDEPKYFLITKDDKTSHKLGHRPAYRIINKGITKSLLPEDIGYEPSVTWGRHHIAITKQKDDEMTSSSMFAMWDAQDPVVRFDKYLEDDERILDEDLVAWLTVGMYHIPHTENVPNTGTIGTTQSFFLTPFNYFEEDPSLASRDAVKVIPRDPKHPNDGAIVDRHNTTLYFSCNSKRIDEAIFKNSTFLFS